MNWNKITRFNFTWAIPDGAWLEDSSGYVNWESYSTIVRHLGATWFDAQRKKQGWMTGCWVTVDPVFPREVAIGVVEIRPNQFRCNV